VAAVAITISEAAMAVNEAGEALKRIVRERKVLVLCGAGGVGKTTTSAALGLAAAKAGRRVLVLTVDPARRLAEAMGIPPHADAPTRVPSERLVAAGLPEGAVLDAWMLDPKVVFERLVKRLAAPK
jgi:anion-transporting  ArsA/GET3 family ATPase